MISAIKEINSVRVIREGNLDKGLFEEVMFEMRPEGQRLCKSGKSSGQRKGKSSVMRTKRKMPQGGMINYCDSFFHQKGD